MGIKIAYYSVRKVISNSDRLAESGSEAERIKDKGFIGLYLDRCPLLRLNIFPKPVFEQKHPLNQPYMTKNPLKVFHPVHVDGLKRLGNNYDGGYVIHYSSLHDADYIVNYGVGYNVAFEKDFFSETGKPTLAFDPTLKELAPIFKKLIAGQLIPFLRHLKNRIVWVSREKTLKSSGITFVEEGIADKDSAQYKSLAYHFKKYGLTDKKIILKIDVEGAEYPVFNDPATYPLLSNAIQILLEFHELSSHMPELEKIMNRLSETHSLIHIHANNHGGNFTYQGKSIPDAIEATFLHNKYLPKKEYSTAAYPVPGLDQPCDKRKKDEILDFFY